VNDEQLAEALDLLEELMGGCHLDTVAKARTEAWTRMMRGQIGQEPYEPKLRVIDYPDGSHEVVDWAFGPVIVKVRPVGPGVGHPRHVRDHLGVHADRGAQAGPPGSRPRKALGALG
jgi:hypothetical protein